MQGYGGRQGWSLQEGSGSWALLTNFLICAVDEHYGSSFQEKRKRNIQNDRGLACVDSCGSKCSHVLLSTVATSHR